MQPSTVSEPCSRNATCLASNTHSMNPLKLKAMAPKKREEKCCMDVVLCIVAILQYNMNCK